MLYRTMKKTGDSLSILGFGCMRLAEKNGRIDEPRASAQILGAVERGVNYIDTAFPYHVGASEPFLGKIIDKATREKVRLATKLPPIPVRVRPDMDLILAKQLANLRTDRIDYYMLHGIEKKSWTRLRGLGALEFLDTAKRDGRIVNAGFSYHGDKDTFREITDAYDWDFCQLQYNFLDQDTQAGTEGLEYAAAKGLGVIIMEPLRGGLLTNRLPAEVTALWEGAHVQRTPAEWAFRWIWNRPEVSMVLSGMNREDQIDENIRIASEATAGSLTTEDLALVERVRQAYQRILKVGCTGCLYCMPCPEGVNIPKCFDLYNRVFSFGEGKLFNRASYSMHMGGLDGSATSYASQCTECGICVKKCPQHIAIPDELKKVRKEFQGFGFKLLGVFAKAFFARAR